MARHLTGLRAWLRPPRNLLVFFVLIVGVPAAALIGLGVRLLEQDEALSQQRQAELLDRAADQAVRVLEQEVAAQRQHLAASGCPTADTPEDSVCVVFRADGISAFPPERIPYYPQTRRLKEAPSRPFEELESFEFRQDFDRALEISRELAGSRDASIRAGALLRQGRIQRKMGNVSAALATYADLSEVRDASILGAITPRACRPSPLERFCAACRAAPPPSTRTAAPWTGAGPRPSRPCRSLRWQGSRIARNRVLTY